MTAKAAAPSEAAPVRVFGSFAAWRRAQAEAGVPPIVAVAGSRGKTTVVRLLDAVFREAGLRTAIWTDHGVEIDGRRQRGELVPWSKALQRFHPGRLDVAIQELDWSTVHAVGLPTGVYPIVVVTNLCLNNDDCLLRTDGRRAAAALDRIRDAVRPDGIAVLNGEDFAVGSDRASGGATILVSVSRDSPLVRAHLHAGGVAAWADDGELRVGRGGAWRRLGRLDHLPLALGGALGFQVSNALLAAAAAAACGIGPDLIAGSLRAFAPLGSRAPGSFNVVTVAGATVIVDRPAPWWFLRTSLRAIGHLRASRLLTVVGRAEAVADADLVETGRLLGRSGGALIHHSEAASSPRGTLLRQGIASNDVPPVVIRVGSERQAVGRALGMLRPGDLAFILADQPAAVLRLVERASERTDRAKGTADRP
jgi:cyanophycin synthetase